MFPLSFIAKISIRATLTPSCIAAIACAGCAIAGCATATRDSDDAHTPVTFYTVTGEIALARGEPRTAALQYAAAASTNSDLELLRRATDVAEETLQPSLAAGTAARWISVDPLALDARRAAAKAALTLDKIGQSAAQYRFILSNSPRGVDAEFKNLETDLGSEPNIFGARQLADRLAAAYPGSVEGLRLQGLTALRADDPEAAVISFKAALARQSIDSGNEAKGLTLALWRAQIVAGPADEPLAQSRALLEAEDTSANRLDYALLLLAAQRPEPALSELRLLLHEPDSAPAALRLMGLIEFQEGRIDAAGLRFAELLTTGKFLDDGFYYLALIAERNNDFQRALRLYAQVQGGENAISALIRGAAILHSHGAAQEADLLLDRLEDQERARAPEILAARARIYADAGDLPRALEVLKEATWQYPDIVDLRYALASMYEEQGQVRPALRELEAIAHARPDDPAAMNALGFTLADHNRHLRRARKLIEHAHAAAPRNAAILDSLGWVLFRQGHDPEALDFLTRAYQDDRGGDIAAHLGEVLWRGGRHAEAERIWDEAGAANLDNRLIQSTRQRLQAAK